jgi:hypothetical protein
MCEPRDIDQVINMLEIAFPNFHPKDVRMTKELYWQTLQDIPSDELKAAVLHCLTQSGRAFAPTIGEIRGAVADIRRAASNAPSAYEAWQIVCRAITEVGSYGSPQFESQLIDRVVRNLGWRNLCMSENQVADRARFLQAYEQLLERATKEEMLLPEVRGYIESRGAVLLDTPNEIRQLVEGMKK